MRLFSSLASWAALAAAAVISFPVAAASPEVHSGELPTPRIIGSVEKQGVRVRLSIQRLPSPQDGTPASVGFRQGDHVKFRFSIHDATGNPLSGAYPAAWMHPASPSERGDPRICKNKAGTFISGSLFSRAEMDLNVYYVVTLNDDASLSVVDPLFGFGGSKLLAMVPLPGIGHDWVRDRQHARIFVSVPTDTAGDGWISRVETASWQITSAPFQSGVPGKIALQPDEHYLWVGFESGVEVLTASSLESVKTLKTGKGAHRIAFSKGSRYAYVTNQGSGTVTVIEVNTLRTVTTLRTGKDPVSIAYSDLADAFYVSHNEDGTVAAISAKNHAITARMVSEPGLGQIRVSPDGRWALLVNPRTHRLSIIDVSLDRIVQSGLVEKEPDQIAFTDDLAYIRHRGSSTLLMIPMADKDFGRQGVRVPVVDTPGGDNPPGQMKRHTPALGIARAPGSNAVLIANPGDKAVYFYKEGMAAPMGYFNNYGRSPRAVLVTDRSLRERTTPGVYETVAELRGHGPRDVVFFLDTPRMTHCFALDVLPAAGTVSHSGGPRTRVRVELAKKTPLLETGRRMTIPFRLTDETTQKPVVAGQSVQLLVSLSPGMWRQRSQVKLKKGGIAELRFTPPLPGFYNVYVTSAELGLALTGSRPIVLEARRVSEATPKEFAK